MIMVGAALGHACLTLRIRSWVRSFLFRPFLRRGLHRISRILCGGYHKETGTIRRPLPYGVMSGNPALSDIERYRPRHARKQREIDLNAPADGSRCSARRERGGQPGAIFLPEHLPGSGALDRLVDIARDYARAVASIERRLSGLGWAYTQRGVRLERKHRHIATVLA